MMRSFTLLPLLLPLLVAAAPVLAQEAAPEAGDHKHMDHGAMDHGAMEQSAPDQGAMDQGAMDHGTMDHGTMDHGTMDHSMHHASSPAMDPADRPGDAPPPPVPADHAADAIFPASQMALSRRAMIAEMRFRTSVLAFDALEYRAHEGKNGYRIEGAAWTGGDTDRAVLAFDAEGAFGEAPESVQLDAYWSRALDPLFNMQLGLRHDVRPNPDRTYALVGVQGHAPYWIEVEAQLFVSNKGDLHLSATAAHDIRVTQRFVIEPEIELDVALQDVPELGIGAGLDTLELALRARYEIERNFAPYLGVSWERKLGDSADFARLEGERPSVVSVLAGLRLWF